MHFQLFHPELHYKSVRTSVYDGYLRSRQRDNWLLILRLATRALWRQKCIPNLVGYRRRRRALNFVLWLVAPGLNHVPSTLPCYKDGRIVLQQHCLRHLSKDL